MHLTKGLDTVNTNKYPFLELSPSSLNMMAEDLKNINAQASESPAPSREKTTGRKLSNG